MTATAPSQSGVTQQLRLKVRIIALIVTLLCAACATECGASRERNAQEFVKRGLQPSWKGFMETAARGDDDGVRIYLDSGFSRWNFAWRGYQRQLLQAAALSGRASTFTLLVDSGADVYEAEEYSGHQIIHFAANRKKPEIVSVLLQMGVPADALGNPEVEGGAFVPMFDALRPESELRESPAMIETIRVLLDGGANVNRTHPRDGESPLHLAAFSGYQNATMLLLENGANVNLPDEKGETPIFYASRNGQVAIIGILIQHGARLEHRNDRGQIAFDVALNSRTRSALSTKPSD